MLFDTFQTIERIHDVVPGRHLADNPAVPEADMQRSKKGRYSINLVGKRK